MMSCRPFCSAEAWPSLDVVATNESVWVCRKTFWNVVSFFSKSVAAARTITPMTTPTKSRCCTQDRKSTRLNSSHTVISYAVFCLKKKHSDGSLSNPADRDSEQRQGSYQQNS